MRGEAGEKTGDKMHNSRCREMSTGDVKNLQFSLSPFLFALFHSVNAKKGQEVMIFTQSISF